MPRIGRLHIPGGCYHVMGRGLERRRIFTTDTDKHDFINRLESGLAETGTQCLAWAIMDNHYHLFLRVGITPLTDLMRKLLSGYATAYNLRNSRTGYVFQNRYKSILCDEDVYLLELVRYIHLNPVRAKIVHNMTALDQYRWTGHAVLMGKQQRSWQQTEAVLSRFGTQAQSARCSYRQFMMQGLYGNAEIDYDGCGLIRSYNSWQGLDKACKEHERKIGDERILGDSEFVEKALRQDKLRIESQTKLISDGWTLEKLISATCDYFRVKPSQITEKGRTNALSTAKSVICYFGTRHLNISTTTLSVRLEMGQSAVSMSSKRGRDYSHRVNLELKDLIKSEIEADELNSPPTSEIP